MKRVLLSLALSGLIAPAWAQDATPAPTVGVDHRTPVDIYRPSDDLRQRATDALQLLQLLGIDNLRINSLERSITLIAGGSLSISINDISATMAEVMALDPRSVMHVEFAEGHGTRLEADGATASINIATKNAEKPIAASIATRGNFYDMHSATATIQAHKKQSHFSLLYDFNIDNFGHTSTANLTTYHFNTQRSRHVDYNGYDQPYRRLGHTLQAAYHLEQAGQYKFHAALSHAIGHTPTNSLVQQFSNTGFNATVQRISQPARSQAPDLKLQFVRFLPHQQILVVNASAAYALNRNTYDYDIFQDMGTMEKTLNFPAEHQPSSFRMRNDAWSVSGVGVYIAPLAGMQNKIIGVYARSGSHSRYHFESGISPASDQYVESASIEEGLMGKLGKLGWNVKVGVNYASTYQNGTRNSKWTWRPNLRLQLSPLQNLHMAYNFSTATILPTLAQLDETRSLKNSYEATQGNADLHPCVRYANNLTINYDLPFVSLVARASYDYIKSPLMPSLYMEQGEGGSFMDLDKVIVWHTENQEDFQHGYLSLASTFHILPQRLDLQLYGAHAWYHSHGNDFKSEVNGWRYGGVARLMLGNWTAQASYHSGPTTMFGIIRSEQAHNCDVRVDYRLGRLSLGLGASYLFNKDGIQNEQLVTTALLENESATIIDDKRNKVYATIGYRF